MPTLSYQQSTRYEREYQIQEKRDLLDKEREFFGTIPMLEGRDRARAIWALCQVRQELWDRFQVKASCSIQEAIR